MKKITFLLTLLLCFGPMTGFAQDQDTTPAAKPSKTTKESPYDLISSDGTVIKYEDYAPLLKEKKVKLPEVATKGNGIVFSNDENLIKDTNDPDLVNLDQVRVFESNKKVPKGSGDVSANVVIGSDGRTKVTNTDISPYRMITYIELDFGDFYAQCSGTVIGKDMVLTNAHCVKDLESGLDAQSAFVLPAVTNSHYSYGSYSMDEFLVPRGYADTNGSSQYDFAIIKTNTYGSYEIGDVTGTLGVKQVTSIKDTAIRIYGYPGDKIESTGIVDQWGMSGTVSDENTSIAYYSLDTAGGQSGSAILNSSNQVIGVHNAAYRRTDGTQINGGPKMTKPMVDFITFASLQ
jgi:glutamyl endopeptidase